MLARGKGLSYSDCCVNDKGSIIDTSRLNHLLSFDDKTGLLVCQGGVTFADLFMVDPHFLPPVIPGTLKATVAGGIANDVHGKNNHKMGCFGHHIEWLELQMGANTLRCDRLSHPELFFATIGGLGLTGVIKRVAIRLHKAPHFVKVTHEKFHEVKSLLQCMQTRGLEYDYQVAWLDLLNPVRALLSLARHCEPAHDNEVPIRRYTLPKLPFRCVYSWPMKQFNRLYFKQRPKQEEIMPLPAFNNPLDAVQDWNRLYGKKGLLQFQALVDSAIAEEAIHAMLAIIQKHKATPTLAVLKYFTQTGIGMLSFAKPGFTLAIDFINNDAAQGAIVEMNTWVSMASGKVYLAKDLLLSELLFKQQYPQYPQFSHLLGHYQSTMRSDLSQRLGITSC